MAVLLRAYLWNCGRGSEASRSTQTHRSAEPRPPGDRHIGSTVPGDPGTRYLIACQPLDHLRDYRRPSEHRQHEAGVT